MPTLSVQFEYRNDTAANWTSANPILANAEPGFETDTGRFKVGDGVTAWSLLAYSSGEPGPQGAAGQGIPTGGAPAQVLRKTDAADYSTQWSNETVEDLGDLTLSFENALV